MAEFPHPGLIEAAPESQIHHNSRSRLRCRIRTERPAGIHQGLIRFAIPQTDLVTVPAIHPLSFLNVSVAESFATKSALILVFEVSLKVYCASVLIILPDTVSYQPAKVKPSSGLPDVRVT
jgi:hypothetical protein